MSEDEPKEIENEENIEFTEKEIIYYCKMFIDNANETFKKVQNDGCLSLSVYNSDIKAIQGLLDLYNKEKEKNKELEEKNFYLPAWVGKKYVSKDKIREAIGTPYPEVGIKNIEELLEK